MPASDSAEEGSDISSFAAWEALHPSQSLDESGATENMGRIWGDRDSSNDGRSSDDDEERVVEDSFGFPVRQAGEGERQGKLAGSLVRKEIPSSDAESEGEEDDAPPSSQPRSESEIESTDEDEAEPAVEDNNVKGFRAEEVIEISSEDEEEESGNEAEDAEIEQDNEYQAALGVAEQQDNDSEAESGVDNEFEGFDVKPEDKNFFNDLLQAAPPEAVLELTGKTQRATSQPISDTAHDTKRVKKIFAEVESLSDIVPGARRIQRVKVFAEDHPFRGHVTWTEDELQEYKDDVYEFARAAGFSNVQAGVEVGKAVGVWKLERGATLPSQLLMEAASETASSTGGKLSEEAKRRRKAEKKARRKLSRIAAQSSRATSSAISETKVQDSQNFQTLKHPKLQSSQSYYGEEARTASAARKSSHDDIALSVADEKSVGRALAGKRKKKAEKRKLRKMAKLGPKKSEYFSSAAPAPAQKPKIVGDSNSRQEEKSQIKEAKPRKDEDDGNRQTKQMAREAKQAVKKAPVLVKGTPAKKKEQKISATTIVEPGLVEKGKKTRKHKRNRNKNKLPQDQSSIKETSGDMVEGKADESILKKRSHDGFPKSNPAQNSGKGENTVLSSFKKLVAENGASSSSQHTLPQSAQDGSDETGRPTKRRDRGRGRKSKNEDSEMPDASHPTVVGPAIPASDFVLESIESHESSSQKQRKRRKSKLAEANIKSVEVGGAINIAALAVLANAQKVHEDRPHSSKQRAMSADAMGFGGSSAQPSKVHHSQ
ncbi:hypothetical protein N431DRAFT_457850 [Stipitochalara longipes BDJ]|nr:hypothetical protein N431DRAFT_457850 [Stipitochalara longipes BDJ]